MENDGAMSTHEATDADDADLLARAGFVTDERREHGKAGAEHARRVFGRDAVGDREDEELVRDDAGRVPALRTYAVGVLRVLYP
jgi:hypothetical protein